jgi:hypothetical protein
MPVAGLGKSGMSAAALARISHAGGQLDVGFGAI